MKIGHYTTTKTAMFANRTALLDILIPAYLFFSLLEMIMELLHVRSNKTVLLIIFCELDVSGILHKVLLCVLIVYIYLHVHVIAFSLHHSVN